MTAPKHDEAPPPGATAAATSAADAQLPASPAADAVAGASLAAPPASAPAPGGGHATRLAAGLLLVAVVGGVATYALRGGGEPTPEAPAPGPGGPPPAVPVEVVTVTREDVALAPRYLAQTGPSHVVEVRSRVSGYLVERAFTEGAAITSGQRLFQIDPRPMQLALSEGRARLAAAEARRERAAQQLARFEQLRARKAATSGDVEEWEKEERVAGADVALQRALIASTELQLEYATITAPISGVIGEAALDVGAHANAASDRLAELQRVDPLYVRFALTERELLLLERARPGEQPGTGAARYQGIELLVTLGDGREHPHRGRIDFVATALSGSTGTITVRGAIPNPDASLRPGQFIHVTMLGLTRAGVIRVPQAAIMHAPASASVYVVGAGDRVEARPVELGEWLGEGLWEVTGGLAPGDRVVTTRLLALRPGAPVSPVQVELQAAVRRGAP